MAINAVRTIDDRVRVRTALASLASSSAQASTSSRMLGRSNPQATVRASFIPSRWTIWSRTDGGAVAVSASTRGWPRASMMVPSRM